jgi:hypothetical protein
VGGDLSAQLPLRWFFRPLGLSPEILPVAFFTHYENYTRKQRYMNLIAGFSVTLILSAPRFLTQYVLCTTAREKKFKRSYF